MISAKEGREQQEFQLREKVVFGELWTGYIVNGDEGLPNLRNLKVAVKKELLDVDMLQLSTNMARSHANCMTIITGFDAAIEKVVAPKHKAAIPRTSCVSAHV